MTAGLELSGVTKRFGENTIVQGIDLVANPGEFIVLVGASGCGKSTILRMIAGLETVTEGRIMIKGRDVTHARPDQRDIAMVFQSYALYPHMSVAENMSFALSLTRTSKSEIKRRVAEAAHILGIEPLLERKPKALSGGQRQRVAMGRAIVREPSVFLFDEPLSNLDAKLRAQMRVELALLHKRLGKTTVYVTHDQVEAMTLANRIVILERGVIQQIGTPGEVFNRPRNLFVAGFIGSPGMNMFKGVLTAADVVVLDGSRATVRLARPVHGPPGAAVVLGVRPQGLALAEGADAVLRMQVKVAEYLGTETVITGALAGSGEAVTSSVSGDHGGVAGTEIGLSIDPKHLHVFDAESQLNLVQ
ncbi:MAG: sn-glycerol-3-phosphate ABC transporter ATP-binding protein UgpC [Betaproteobacteria bacterium]|nr:sn-glycerol-3-phosphate ABC transporter ATP-binding protein UgpC [Betaproteobacteria bacterium]MBK8688142.1 sn-glycerol-3-phosphate ABC transporter ATP-binding protein UgpC [Betaproteobacteria bacterium]MBK9676963.1 sn-glycerol-3-phosphate ABC transporter ATP-binding protein UgpC [Betaproteobacteria bacterium]